MYPEFKGWHAKLYWLQLQSKAAGFTVYAGSAPVYLQMLQPARPLAAPNDNTVPPFPGNTIGFFQAISPIGTKFQAAQLMGPQSQPNRLLNGPFGGSLLFDFRPIF